jgi:dephospho-CoA kinase
MLLVGLTGGIGSGKTTFAALLAERGAQVIDADVLGHDALKPGRPAWHSIVDQFGDEILSPTTMEIDRKRLAEIVFGDDGKRAALNAIVHPEIFRRMADAIDRLRNTDSIVVIDAALVFETGLADSCDVIVVVFTDKEIRANRLVRSRGMTLEQITARMASQTDPSELRDKADIVVMNDGYLEDLAAEADRVWADLESRNAERK